jgi:hypothetical protein
MDVFKTFFNLTLLEKVATIEYVEGSFGV